MTNLSDEQQFELFRRGDKNAFAWFYTKHHKGIHKYVKDLSADDDLAKDITQDVFKRLWDLRGNINSANHLRAYVYIMARQLFLQHLRRGKTAFDAAQDLAYLAKQQEAMNKELELACNHLLVAVDAAMKMLSPQRRLVIELLYIKGYDTATVARLLDVSRQTVRNTKTDALNFLRGKLYDRDLLMPLVLTALLLYIDQG